METHITQTPELKEKEDFFVFLDFDGVLYDLEYAAGNMPSFKELFSEDKKLISFAPDSIDALNKLFAEISTKYNPHLVISSFWRFLPTNLLINTLQNNGLNTTGVDIHKTKITLHPHKRGLEIKEFLQRQNNSENFIIADDSYRQNYLEHFPPEKIVTTNIVNDRLVASKLDVALTHYGLTPISTANTPRLHSQIIANASKRAKMSTTNGMEL